MNVTYGSKSERSGVRISVTKSCHSAMSFIILFAARLNPGLDFALLLVFTVSEPLLLLQLFRLRPRRDRLFRPLLDLDFDLLDLDLKLDKG